MASILDDILDDDIKQERARIIVSNVFGNKIVNRAAKDLPISKTAGASKSLEEFYDLVRQAKDNSEMRGNVPEENRIIFTEEEPDVESETETITFSLVKRMPGKFSQGAPFEGDVANLRPILREQGPDVENPGYNYAVSGYWHDNLVKFTCWARTNKTANARAKWFEDMMEDYSWWFSLSGVSRVIFWGRDSDIVTTIDNNKWYGRPLNYFVRTEKLKVYSEKQMEEMLIQLTVKAQ